MLFLGKRINPVQRLRTASQRPSLEQFVLVQVDPLYNQTVCSPRQLTPDYFCSQNVYHGFVFTVYGVEMRGRMISPEHHDDDPIKSTKLRHESFRGALGITPLETCPLASGKVSRRTTQFHHPT